MDLECIDCANLTATVNCLEIDDDTTENDIDDSDNCDDYSEDSESTNDEIMDEEIEIEFLTEQVIQATIE